MGSMACWFRVVPMGAPSLSAMVVGARLDLPRSQVLAFRRRTGALDVRLAPSPRSFRRAAWAGLQDSAPRAALVSLHARVGTIPSTGWEDPSLVQLWGPRFNVVVVAREDVAVFSQGTLPDDAKGRQRAEDLADRLTALLGDQAMSYDAAGDALGLKNANMLRYAAATGRLLIRWEGARCPIVWTVPPPDVDPHAARLELARRFLHVYGPATPDAFSRWAGIGARSGGTSFESLASELVPVRTPIADAWILAADEVTVRSDPPPPAPARLLPSGDAYLLHHGPERDLLVPEPHRRDALWTSRVWPGGLLIAGEVAGTWRRAGRVLSVDPWRTLSATERDAVAAEVASLALPGLEGRISLRFGA
jgi:Winged helix DNA-binding domain